MDNYVFLVLYNNLDAAIYLRFHLCDYTSHLFGYFLIRDINLLRNGERHGQHVF